jgi:hypothetical protein
MSPTKATKKPAAAQQGRVAKKVASKKAAPEKSASSMAVVRAAVKAAPAPVARSAANKPSLSSKTAAPVARELGKRPVPAPAPEPKVEARGSAREQSKAAPVNPEPKVAAPVAVPPPPPPPASEPPVAVAPDAELEPKKEKAPSAVEKLAQELVAANDSQTVLRHLSALEDEREAPSTLAARLVAELTDKKPELLVPLIERFARLLVSKNKRVVHSAAAALAPLSRIAPAKVAKQLPVLTQNWEGTTEEGKDGLVRTFAGLCTASVAYQKRLEPALARALGEADPKLLIRWTEIVLPALKGEPHARARAVVEERLYVIPRPVAQKIADFLGIKLRPAMRP